MACHVTPADSGTGFRDRKCVFALRVKGNDLTSTFSANPTQAISAPTTAPCAVTAVTAVSRLRGSMLLAGAVGCGLLSIWIWMLGRVDGKFVLIEREVVAATIPSWLVLLATAGAGLGLVGSLWALMRDQRLRSAIAWCVQWIKTHPLASLIIALVIAAGAIDFYELFVDAEIKRYNRDQGVGLRKYMLREDAKAWLLFASTVMSALALSAMRPWCDQCKSRVAGVRSSLRQPGSAKRWLLLAFFTPVILGSAMNLVALDGVPHFSDSLTYQMQGRMLYAGQMTMEKPAHPELFIHSLFFVTDGQYFDEAQGHIVYEGTRFFGKYPLGWPAILGFFDKLGLGFMANAVLAGLGALLTFGLARQVTTQRVAIIAALLFAFSPWAWFNGSHFASHVASMLAVNGFLFFFLKVLAVGPRGLGSIQLGASQLGASQFGTSQLGAKPRAAFGAAAGAGLCLGAALLIRPFDAAMFALPAVLVSFALLVREPKKWITHGAIISLATGIGIAIYFWSNAMTTGKATLSPYTLEGRWAADWDTSITSILHRLQFQWAEMNARMPGYGIGSMTIAILGSMIAFNRGRFHKSLAIYVLLASNVLFFVANTPFLFTNVWWGPRWLLPVTPMIAVLMAEFVDRVMQSVSGRKRDGRASSSASAAQLVMMVLLAGTLVGLIFDYGGQWAMHRVAPPHNVSAAANDRAQAMGLNNVVIGMPVGGDGRAPLDGRAGMVYMKAPLESNSVIYVRQIEKWQPKTRETFPDRQLYELIADKEAEGGFVIRKVE